MDKEILEMVLKKLNELEKKLEIYYQKLKIENELSFILNGTYIFPNDIEKVINGTY